MASTKRNAKNGVSLAKGPVAILGAVMLAYGILALILGATSFNLSFPSGDVDGETFLGIENNGWTAVLWIAAGALLLFGSPFHWGAKTTAMIVGLVLGAASVIAMFDGWSEGDVLGVIATNNWTILALGAAATVLLLASLLPRTRGKEEHHEPVRDHEPVREHRPVREDEPVRERETIREPETTGRVHRAEPVATERHHEERIVAPASDHEHREDESLLREDDGRFDRTRDRDGAVDADGTTRRNR